MVVSILCRWNFQKTTQQSHPRRAPDADALLYCCSDLAIYSQDGSACCLYSCCNGLKWVVAGVLVSSSLACSFDGHVSAAHTAQHDQRWLYSALQCECRADKRCCCVFVICSASFHLASSTPTSTHRALSASASSMRYEKFPASQRDVQPARPALQQQQQLQWREQAWPLAVCCGTAVQLFCRLRGHVVSAVLLASQLCTPGTVLHCGAQQLSCTYTVLCSAQHEDHNVT
jgi:hypothetical protein